MRRMRAAYILFLLPVGCASGPMLDNPLRVPPTMAPEAAEAAVAYPDLFDLALDAVDDYFPIAYANRYEGRILGRATVAPGFEQLFKPGSPSHYERALVTLQSYRYRCEVKIRTADPAGYFVEVIVRKELKDIPTPAGVATAVSVFGDTGTVDREDFVVVDADATSPEVKSGERWIPKGRDAGIEQRILLKIKTGDRGH